MLTHFRSFYRPDAAGRLRDNIPTHPIEPGRSDFCGGTSAPPRRWWSQQRPPTFGLTALLAALAFYTLIRYRDAEGETAKRRWLTAFALAVGFGITHHLSLVFMAVF